jgi:hypothetical protein
MDLAMSLDRTSEALRQEISKASDALVRTSREAPHKWWMPQEIEAAAKNGESHAAVQLALSRLIEDGIFLVEQDKVRLSD